jgi:translation elongation factor EF-1alpha
MDDPSVKYSESRYKEIVDELKNYLKKVGYPPPRLSSSPSPVGKVTT